MSEKTMKEKMLDDVKELRIQGRHLRDIDAMLSHAAYRSARSRIRSFRLSKRQVAICYCAACVLLRA